jgi:hypothetical protein
MKPAPVKPNVTIEDLQKLDIRVGTICSMCGAELEEGYLSYCTGAVRHREQPTGLRRMFWSAFPTGERVYGSWASNPVVSSIPALRCPGCSSVVVATS